MTHAYAESYLNDAMENLGEAFDYAVNACMIDIETFMGLFISSGYANLFGKGVPKVVSGLSGTELVMEVVNKAGTFYSFPKPQVEYDYSPEYWCGWILAYYQWKTGRTFKDIEVNLSVTEILKMYPTLHEASEDKFVDTANAIILRRNNTTRLQRQRKQCGLTQKELSEKSGVKLRTVQQYEMKAKDINKAAVSTVLALSNVLGCRIEDLLEYKVVDDE
ncbi:helix-turn-helix transcriptional regulator [uncultured Bacteroides sp.]|uniref:helix-turn-helix domain-containing protein n=1 Tax=uncultured Bacteroides sp. TaxID=162156 RepID=UPI002599B651|nr:helix-turn-helix transcriptional regulator [uncultured Bacteroides sp.]